MVWHIVLIVLAAALLIWVVQGKLVEDFASLLKSLWSQEYLCIFPSKFKRGLIKYKPQFAGNEQQDSQVQLQRFWNGLNKCFRGTHTCLLLCATFDAQVSA